VGAVEALQLTLPLRPQPAYRSAANLPPLGALAPAGPTVGLPAFPVELEWKAVSRLWGHALHPMCSYLGAFPAGLSHAFIARYTRPGDVVLDPFSGRGTTPLQACAEGRVGIGNDLNPLAHLLTAAKIDPPEEAELYARLADLRAGWSTLQATRSPALPAGRIDAAAIPAEVRIQFHPRTLHQLLFLRAALDRSQRTDRFLAATVTGILHGHGQTFLSTLMPNTFSMPPAYVLRYAETRGLRPEPRDVFDALALKLRRLLRDPLPPTRGIALFGDARDAGTRTRDALQRRALPGRVRLVVTSPPYLRVVRYGSCNWLRLWFLGLCAADVDATLDHAHRPPAYLQFLREVLADLRTVLADDAVVVLVLGDVESDRGHRLRSEIGLAARVWEGAAEPEGYRLAGIAPDEIAAHRKSTRIWGAEAGRATRTDRLLVVAPTELGRRRALAGAALPIDWSWPLPPRPRLVSAQGSR
jgi:hypothetical protein